MAIGDSIPYNSPDDCPNCTGFVDSYAQALTDQNAETYTAVNRSRHDGARTADILEEVQSGSLDEELSDAAVIIVSVGYNDQPPYDTGSCADTSLNLDTAAGAADALIATTADCIADRTGAAGADLAGVLKHARDLAPDARIVVLTAFNAWTGWSDFEALGAHTVRGASQTVATSLDAWRTTACEEAERIEGECVDLLTAFNGPDGLTPSGDLLAADYTHPSQKGNDLIRDLLLDH
ncbi:SGNH/GDSL hydrolase family protein [Arthrobacter sp. B0490]|uniref:SGNH/GDSL hydrolase family protein n=1 Tax=Arthrobacter sp. B0490 TaxID=2058891 RepID=UPI0015E3EEBF|nr:SGNH/GDSL hydrolase family protein [Arthrobacter sp. B0490]